MRPSRQDLLARWLTAERDDRADEAEAALLALFEEHPRPEPPAGFADRVLARVAFAAPAPVQRSLFASPWRRALMALALPVTGIALLCLPVVLRTLAGLWSLSDLVRLWTAFLTGAAEGFASLVAFGDWLFTIGRALASSLATPTMAQVMVVCLVVSAIAFRFLRDLITRDRSLIHEPI